MLELQRPKMAHLSQPIYPSMPKISSKPSVRESAFFASATLFSVLRLNCG
jgi:hypothetical protein